MGMVEKAIEELKILRGDHGPDEMQDLMEKCILDIVKLFASQGHSGFSAAYAIPIINALLKQECITPLTGEDSEWTEVSENVYQNRRVSSVFKDPNVFNGQAYWIDGKIFSDDGGRTWYTGRDSLVPITFPWMPTEPERVILSSC